MNEEFVYKNIYEVDQRRLEEKIDHAVERNDTRTDYLMASVNATLSEIKGELTAMKATISNMGWTITLAIGILGIVIAVVGLK